MKKNHKNSYTHRDINNIKASNQPFNIRVKFLHVNLKKFYNRARRVRTKRNQYIMTKHNISNNYFSSLYHLFLHGDCQ